MVHEAAEKAAVPTLLVRDPGTTEIGEQVREILLSPRSKDMAMRCEMLLFMAARAQMMKQIIGPALNQGKLVISDRFISSTLAYQLGGDGLTAAEIRKVGDIAVVKRWPDVTFIFDLPVSISSSRVRPKFSLFPDDPDAGAEKDRIELRSAAYHEQVRKNYLKQAKGRADYRIIDASGSIEQIHENVMKELNSLK